MNCSSTVLHIRHRYRKHTKSHSLPEKNVASCYVFHSPPAHRQYTDRDLIESLLSSFYIVDYGFVSAVNSGGTVNVIHAVKQQLHDGSDLERLETKQIEVLRLSGAGFSLCWDINRGDKMLLLGLKEYIESVKKVKEAQKPPVYVHYNRATLKAFPLCVFDSSAAVTVQAKDSTLSVQTKKKIELNGNTKQFVTWQDLNTALQALVAAINTHTHLSQVLHGRCR